MGLFELGIFWCLCAIYAAVLFEARGYNSFTGLLHGLLLGPFGLVFAGLMPLNTTELERRQLQRKEMDMCPLCSELVRPSATVCRSCGRDLP